MQLIKINKTRYRRHLNRVIVGSIAIFITGSLVISQSLIALYPNDDGNHFYWNLLGVVLTGAGLGFSLNKYRGHSFMTEVVYVWDLKQVLNKINRKMPKLQKASLSGNVNAMLAIHYSFAGSRLLWELDDNTIIMDELVIQQAELDSLATKYQLTLDSDKYDASILQQF